MRIFRQLYINLELDVKSECSYYEKNKLPHHGRASLPGLQLWPE